MNKVDPCRVEIEEGKHYQEHYDPKAYNATLCALNLDVVAWIRDNDIGPFSIFSQRPGATLFFDHKEDALAFKLAWL